MNKKWSIFAVALGVVVSLGMLRVDAATKGEKGLLVGHAVEISTFVTKGLSDETREEMKNRALQGFPVGIIEEETNELWICIFRNNAPASGIEPANAKMAEHMGLKVVTQGLKYTADGLNVIRFGVISEY